MDIAIPLFDGITALDAIGPYEVLSRLPGARVRFVAETPGPKRTDNKQLTLMADDPLSAARTLWSQRRRFCRASPPAKSAALAP